MGELRRRLFVVAMTVSTAHGAWAQSSAPSLQDLPQTRSLPPQEAAAERNPPPSRYLQTALLGDRGIDTFGWLAVGVGANNWGTPFNGTITFSDRNWQVMMNQLYLVNERTLDADGGEWDIGGRIDLLYGTDAVFTTAAGLDAYDYGSFNSFFVPRWNSSKYYGLAMPQLYAEVGTGDLALRFGHFYTIIGYEVVTAVGDFFYTICNTFQYGEPFTHTGMLSTWTPNEQLVTYAGIVNGWDNWDSGTPSYVTSRQPGYDNNAGFLGGITLRSSDESQSLSLTTYTGNVPSGTGSDPIQAISANRSYASVVYTNELSDRLTWVLQHDAGWQFGLPDGLYPTVSGQQPGLAQWYGFVNYLFWKFDDRITGGMRVEYFRDNNGFRVMTPLRNADMQEQPAGDVSTTGFQGNFWELTFGINTRANANWMIRPELRYDWYTPDRRGGPLPFGGPIGRLANASGTEYGQFYGGGDVIFQF